MRKPLPAFRSTSPCPATESERPYPPRALGFTLALFAFLTLSTSLAAQDDGADQEDPVNAEAFIETVDVEVVNIDVYVSDGDGKPVEGLSKDDFVIYRDGTPIPATNFYAVAGGAPVPGPALEAPTPQLEAATPEPVQEPDTPSEPTVDDEHRLWLIVFIDNFNIDPVERNRILPAVRQFISQSLHRGDRAMVVTYDRKLEVRQPFTNQKNLLLKTLSDIEDDSGLATIRNRDRYEALTRIEGRGSRPSSSLLFARTYAEEVMSNVDNTVDALERLILTLGGLPGRKALVHVSSGIPMLAGEELFQVVGLKWNMPEAYAEIGRHDTTRAWERVNRHANAHRVVFYTLDAGGLRGMEFASAEYASFLNPKLRTSLDSTVPQNLQSSLRLMALETGGRALVNRNEALPALIEVAQDFRSFYSLGIPSSGADAGRYHEISVKLRNPQKGHKLRHRTGYRSKNLEGRMHDGLRSALLYAHGENPLGVTVRWGKPVPHEDDLYLVPLQLQVPLKDLVILPLGDKHEVRLQLFVGAVGKDGEVSQIDRAPLGVRLAEEHVEAARKESLVHTHKLLLSPGRKKVGISVLDTFGRQSSTVTSFIDVGPEGN